MKLRWSLTAMVLASLLLVVASCNNTTDTNCPNCPTPATPPEITALTVTPDMLDQGGTAAVSVTASNTVVSYAWTATGGSFDDATKASTTWHAPSAPGVHMLTCTVTGEGSLKASRSKAVGVEMSLQLVAEAPSVTIANKVMITARAVGDNLIYKWNYTDGSLHIMAHADTVHWKAPDTVPATPPVVQVLVADGSGNTRTASLEMTVDDYTPTDTPSYLGGLSGCSGACHGDIKTAWAASVHAGAWQALNAIGMGENASCLACHSVGSMGLLADPALNNGGYDEIPLAKLRNVQCENCHGPGSGHNNGAVALPKSMEASLCGACHTDAHHPTYDEWQGSLHSKLVEPGVATGPVYNRSCVKCHNGLESAKYLDDPATYVPPAVNLDLADSLSVTCQVCHDPHGNNNKASLRNASATDIVLPDGTVVPEAGAGRLCMACHNGRRTPVNINDQIANGSAHFGPHPSNQGDMLAGTGAYEGVAPDGFLWLSARHLLVEDGCVHCHTHPHPGNPEGGGAPNFTGHSFAPTVEACKPCHSTLASFETFPAGDDYDGDGDLEPLITEVEQLADSLKHAIILSSDTQEHMDALTADFEGGFDTMPPITTVNQRKAGYNYFFVLQDKSKGIHNSKYAVQLMQQSMKFLGYWPGKAAELK